MKICCLYNQTIGPQTPPYVEFQLFKVPRLTPYLAAVIITMGTTGCCLTRNVNIGHNKLLSQSACMVNDLIQQAWMSNVLF